MGDMDQVSLSLFGGGSFLLTLFFNPSGSSGVFSRSVFEIMPVIRLMLDIAEEVSIAEKVRRSIDDFWAQHFLNFFPEPQGQGSFRPIFMVVI